MSVSNSFCQIHGCQLEDDGTCIVCIEEGRRTQIIEAEWQEREI